MLVIKLEEEFREPIEEIKKYFPKTSNSQVITNIINSYLPIYLEGIRTLHNPKLTIGRSDTGIGVTTSTLNPVNPYLGNDGEPKTDSSPEKVHEPNLENSTEKNKISEEIPEELENLFD